MKLIAQLLLCVFVGVFGGALQNSKNEICFLTPFAGKEEWDPSKRWDWHYDYSYDKENNSCDPFIYGGSGGNANRFSTLDECETNCKRKRRNTI